MKRGSSAHSSASVTPRSSYSLEIIVILGSLCGLVVNAAIFLAYRQNDVGQVPTLLAQFFRQFDQDKIFGWQSFLAHAGGALIALSVVLCWLGVGARIFRFLAKNEEDLSISIRLAWSCGIGASVWSGAWFFLGLIGGYKSSLAVVLVLLGLPLGILEIIKYGKLLRGRARRDQNGITRAAQLLVLFPIGLALISALAPITGKDAMVYRLAIPKIFLAAGGLSDVGTNIFGYLSFGAEMNGLWAMLVSRAFDNNIAETAFGVVSFAYFPLLLVAVYGIAKEWLGDRSWALVATALLATIPTMYMVAASSYVDHALTFYLTLAVQALARWWRQPQMRKLCFIVLFLSGALAVKFLALFAFLAFTIIILFRARQVNEEGVNSNRLLLSGMAALCGAGLLASPWYVRTWDKTGSPLFPFYAHLWKGSAPGWDALRSQLSQILLSQYGGDRKGILDFLLTPFKLSWFAQPEIPANFDGVLGIAFLLGLPFLIWGLARKKLRIEFKIAATFAGTWYFCWLMTSEQLRFLLPALPALLLIMIGSACAVSRGKNKTSLLQAIVLAAALPGFLVILAWFLEVNPMRVVLGGETKEAFLERRLDYYPYYEIINRDLPPSARVWLINMRNDTLHLERPFFADYVFEDYTLTEMIKESSTLPEVQKKVKAMGITHLLVRHDLLLDFARTPVVDERKSESENQAKFQLLKSFLTQQTKILKADERFLLMTLDESR